MLYPDTIENITNNYSPIYLEHFNQQINQTNTNMNNIHTRYKVFKKGVDLQLFVDSLKKNKHTCHHTLSSDPLQVRWCGDDVCANDPLTHLLRKINSETESFETTLKHNGHTCIYHPPTYPVEIGWCKEPTCVNQTYGFIYSMIKKNEI